MACAWLRPPAGAPSVPAPLRGAVAAALGAGRAAGRDRLRRAADDERGPAVRRRRRALRAAAGSTYEGQAAIELEAVADAAERGAYALRSPATSTRARRVRAVARRRRARASRRRRRLRALPPRLAAATAAACAAAAASAGLDLVVLSGGVFQNRLLLDAHRGALERRGLRVLVPERLPPNDGGIAFGQAAVAAARG